MTARPAWCECDAIADVGADGVDVVVSMLPDGSEFWVEVASLTPDEASMLAVACDAWIDERGGRFSCLDYWSNDFAVRLEGAALVAENTAEALDEQRRAEDRRAYWAGV